jgi:hypothetical protein
MERVRSANCIFTGRPTLTAKRASARMPPAE